MVYVRLRSNITKKDPRKTFKFDMYKQARFVPHLGKWLEPTSLAAATPTRAATYRQGHSQTTIPEPWTEVFLIIVSAALLNFCRALVRTVDAKTEESELQRETPARHLD